MKSMPDLMYHSEYCVHTVETTTKRDVTTHLLSYTIAEGYMIRAWATTPWRNTTRAVTPEYFAELIGVLASNTEALPVHSSLRNVAFHRIDELAECRSLLNVRWELF
jgi:hypothetical protein